ncbi:MAG: radical SAM protein, partial [Gammaproteobacteria bacterium]
MSNIAGEHLFIPEASLAPFVLHELSSRDPAYRELRAKHFLIDKKTKAATSLLPIKIRTRYSRLPDFTRLHMFVVSLRCEHSCPYCQVSRQSDDKLAFDMSEETALKSLRLALSSPSNEIKIEFQGGESLLNFELIKFIVQQAKAMAGDKRVSFVIATNLAVITDEILAFCKEHAIDISTSLDGPEDLHNANRPRPGRDSYQRTIEGIERVRNVLGVDHVSALMTTTKASLGRVRDIIDEYLANGFHNIFLRPLSPYGFAIRTRAFSGYDSERW